jgi:threonine/homoserine/homoserine lactone efflux protein
MISLFLSTALASFLGSLQLGLVNSAVIKTALEKRLKASLWLAFGGCLPELIYAFIATFVYKYVITLYEKPFKIISLSVLVVYGIFLIVKKNKLPTSNSTISSHAFLKGFVLGSINPQLLIFWSLFLGVSPLSYLVNSNLGCSIFGFGAAFGAFVVLTLFSILFFYNAKYLEKKINAFQIDKLIGWVLIIIAIIGCLQFYL